MIKKSDDQLFSSKIDLIVQLEDLLTDLKKCHEKMNYNWNFGVDY
jgi:hypothetical protein